MNILKIKKKAKANSRFDKMIKRRKAWKDFKDVLLLLFLLNILINNLKQIDLEIFYEATPATVVYKKDNATPSKEQVNVQDQLQDSLVVKDIVEVVYKLESSGGKNDSCKDRGLFNGYGYAQNSFTWNCFDSKEEVEGLVIAWFEKNLKDKSIAESLCYYNEGVVRSDCKYYENFKSLAG